MKISRNRKHLLWALPIMFVCGVILGIIFGLVVFYEEAAKAWKNDLSAKELWYGIKP